ncbi:transcription factor TGA2.3-like isoform X1 [Nymphaea colorata]|nr:transcription factor TGA2.3-like isoform X1 [Nymphaea colorata]
MGSNRIAQPGLSEPEPSHQHLVYGGTLHGIHPSQPSFIDEHGAAYGFGELEEAFMPKIHHGVGIGDDGDRKPFLGGRPPTLDIFPSWPMRFQPPPGTNSRSAESTDSGSAQNTASCRAADAHFESESPMSSRKASDQLPPGHQPNPRPAEMAFDPSSRTPTAAPGNQLKPPDKKKAASSSSEKDGSKISDAKTLRRLAQNREAARKSRLRKKAYVQQLENSRIKLNQLEQELQRARSQGLLLAGAGGGNLSSGAAIFDMEHSRWLEEDQRHMSELQAGIHAHLPDGELRVIVDSCLSHYDEIFRLKGIAAKTDVFHLFSGMWKTPAERCFLWMGGFRPSDLLKILVPQLEPLTEQQFLGICSLQQSSQQAEEALSQGLDSLQQALAETIAAGSLSHGPDAGNYMGQMAIALGKLANYEGFVRQADNLRQQTLHQLRRILTIRQAARCFLAIGEYYSRLRALSSLWASRPREAMISEAHVVPSATDLQMVQVQHPENHFGF